MESEKVAGHSGVTRHARRELGLIGAASGWGAGARVTEEAADALLAWDLPGRLAARGIACRWEGTVRPTSSWNGHLVAGQADLSPVEAYGLVADHARRLSVLVEETVRAGRMPVILGGDHAIALGSWSGVARALDLGATAAGGQLGLIWFDAHMDAHTPQTTPTHNAHGMGMSALLGHGLEAFVSVAARSFAPADVAYVGTRSYEAGEAALLERLGVRIFFMEEVTRRGLAAVTADAAAVARTGTQAFGLSIDLDGFDPADVGAVGLHEPGGLRVAEMLPVLTRFRHDPRLAAIEIVEYIPSLDPDHRDAGLILELVTACCGDPERPGR